MIISNEPQDYGMSVYFDEKGKYVNIKTQCLMYDKGDNDYSFCSEAYYNKPICSLTIDFLNTDFNSIDAFEDFLNRWGIPGFLKIAYPDKENYLDYISYPKEMYKSLIKDLFDKCRDELIQAQYDFKEIINLCINDNGNNDFKNLSPIKRYYAIVRNPNYSVNIEKYNKNLPYSCEICIEDDDDLYSSDNSVLNEFLDKKEVITRKVYYTQDIRSLLYLEFFNSIKAFPIKKCVCGKYFIPENRSDEIYCNSCKGLSYDVISKIKKDEVAILYRQAYKNRYGQKNRRLLNAEEALKDTIETNFKNWVKIANMLMYKVKDADASAREKHLTQFKEFLEEEVNWLKK